MWAAVSESSMQARKYQLAAVTELSSLFPKTNRNSRIIKVSSMRFKKVCHHAYTGAHLMSFWSRYGGLNCPDWVKLDESKQFLTLSYLCLSKMFIVLVRFGSRNWLRMEDTQTLKLYSSWTVYLRIEVEKNATRF